MTNRSDLKTVKFTPADREYFEKVRREDPSVDEMLRTVRQVLEAFKGRIVHLTIHDNSWGTPMPEGERYVFPERRPESIPKGTKQQRPASVQQRRRAMTKYKGG